MPSRADYEKKLELVVEEIFQHRMSEPAKKALVWLLVEFMLSVDAISQNSNG